MERQHNYFVFMDIDGTLIKIKTMRSFLKFFYQQKNNFTGYLCYKRFQLGSMFHKLIKTNREYMNRRYYQQYNGCSASKVMSLSGEWFKGLENTIKDLYIKSILQKIAKHKDDGAQVVMVSGSFAPCLLPLAKKFGFDHILATNLEAVDGVYTGNILLPQTIGAGKAAAIKNFLDKHKEVDASFCYAYGDHMSDLPMLRYVGNPYVVKGDAKLEAYALSHGWPILSNN